MGGFGRYWGKTGKILSVTDVTTHSALSLQGFLVSLTMMEFQIWVSFDRPDSVSFEGTYI